MNPKSKRSSRKKPPQKDLAPSREDIQEARYQEPSDDELLGLEDMGAILTEMAALEAIFEANRMKGSQKRALFLCKEALLVGRTPQSVEEHVTRAALCKATGTPFFNSLKVRSEQNSWNEIVYHTVALAWLSYIENGTRADGLVATIKSLESSFGHIQEGAVELLALGEWAKAVEAITCGSLQTAKKHFERAIEIGSQVGSDSNPTINWTYAASFFSS